MDPLAEDTPTLDTVNEHLQEPARILQEAAPIEQQLLPDRERTRLERTLTENQDANKAQEDWAAHIAQLRREADSHPAHTAAQKGSPARQLAKAAAHRPTPAPHSFDNEQRARQALEHDTQLRKDHQELLAQAAEARSHMWHVAEQAIRRAVTTNTFPTWFTWAAGTRPGTAAAANEWLQATIDLIVFRARYNIDDPILPFGTPTDDPDRRRLSEEISWRCDQARRPR